MNDILFSTGNPYPCRNRELECENEGFCEVSTGSPHCICQPGYAGEKCQFMDEPANNVTANATGY